MKNLLYKFDQAPILFRIFVLLLGSGGLLTGYVYGTKELQKNRVDVDAVRVKMREEREAAKEEARIQEEAEQNKQLAEEALAKVESETTQENLAAAKEAVSKVTDEESKQAFDQRIQAVEAKLQPVAPQPAAPAVSYQPTYTQGTEYIVQE